jgi:hypothetical protein
MRAKTLTDSNNVELGGEDSSRLHGAILPLHIWTIPSMLLNECIPVLGRRLPEMNGYNR